MQRLLNLLLLFSFFTCYMDWGHDGASFIGEMEISTIINSRAVDSSLVIILLLVLVLAGQIALLIAAVKPNSALTIWAIALLGIIVLIILLFGLFTFNGIVILSTFPFIVLSAICITRLVKARPGKGISQSKEG